MWRRSRWAPLPIVLALIALLLGSNSWISNSLVRSLEWQNIPQSELPVSEAIVVLGGCTKPAIAPRPGVGINDAGDRILYSAQLYRQGKAPLVIASGGRIDWQGSKPPESEDMEVILSSIGVPQYAIIQEPFSLNTYQNAVNVRKILDAKHIHRVLLVTSALHMPRSLLIFRRQGIEAIPAPTDFIVTEQDIYEANSSIQSIVLNFLPDTEQLQKTTKALKEYIGIVIYRLRGWI
ncbi:MAG: YdcF family protein [Chamaesiphon sp.]